ncbi:MAG: hypothetical protein ABJB01_01080 [Rudaea sp.]
MKSFKMKALAVAVLGLAGLGLASSASAACPTDPFSAWSSDTGGVNSGAQLGGQTVGIAPGLNSTGCAMQAKLTTAPGSNSEEAVVFDNSPQKEQTYRFRFYVDPSAIGTSLSNINTVEAFAALSGSTHGPVLTQKLVAINFVAVTGAIKLRTFVACTSGDGLLAGRCKSTAGDLALPAFTAGTGVRVEGQLIIGAAGTGKLNLWVGTNTGTPDRTINVDNSAWGTASGDGVVQAVMGLGNSTPNFRTAAVNKAVLFDEFDSRRQTAIGN